MRAMVAARGRKGKAFGSGPSVPLASRLALPLLLALAVAGCSSDTSRLDPERTRRFQAEGIVRHAENIVFRYTEGAGTRESSWEDRAGSIVVTRQTVLIHKNEKIGLEVTSRTRKVVGIERRGQRVRIRVGRGRSAEIWSFVPPDDAEGWARDLRAVRKEPAPE
ncbi:MAG TPA: hypothetical protein VFT97_01600 [Candidatus Eisenbacteria bacterium]|nr:hypothetical protein [Candidatus Eisenbacteria bacterium]